MGRIEVGREESPREVRLAPEQLAQLALQFAAAVAGTPAEEPKPFFGELVAQWLEKIASRRVHPGNERRLAAHLRPLFLENEDTLLAGDVSALLEQLELGPSTVNKVRGAGRQAIEAAQAAGLWSAPNPFALVRRRREVRPAYHLLSLEELARVQAKLRPDRRRLFRVALHLGLRTGELFALRREDVDFARGVVLVRRSHGRDTTKTGRERTVPIHPAVAGDLLEALQAHQGELVFPGTEGHLQRADTKLTRVLRAAMASAGVGVLVVTYKCRRRGCGHVQREVAPAVREVDCACGFRLWPVPEVRPCRWYDLRHMCATLHHQHGADPLCVSLALGHSVRGTTQAVYTHPDDAMMRRELTRWRLG